MRSGLGRRPEVAALALVIAAGLTVSGCKSLGNAIGVGKQPPDEFAVVSKAPLAMPPDFALRPPQPGAERPQEMSPQVRAEQTVFGTGATAPAAREGTSPGETSLLTQSGADRSDAAIRDQVDNEAPGKGKDDKESEGFFARLWPF